VACVRQCDRNISFKKLPLAQCLNADCTVEPLLGSYRRVTGKFARKAVGEKRRVVKRDNLAREEPVVEDRVAFKKYQSEDLEAGKETLDLVESDAPGIELETE